MRPPRGRKRSSDAPPTMQHSNEMDEEKMIMLDDGDQDWSDCESESTLTRDSSRRTSNSSAPMLPKPAYNLSRKRTSSPSRRYRPSLQARLRCSRYFSLMLGFTLVAFILTLTHLRAVSVRNVELGIGRPPPPPPAWEEFPFLKRYHGGVRTLVERKDNTPEYPGASALSDLEKIEQEAGQGEEVEKVAGESPLDDKRRKRKTSGWPQSMHEAFAPTESSGRSVETCYLDEAETIRIPSVKSYSGIPRGMPNAVIGSHEALNLPTDICFERFGRYGPYGMGYSTKYGGTGASMEGDREGMDDAWSDVPQVDYRNVSWANVQERCIKKNADHLGSQSSEMNKTSDRTAILLRTWHDYEYGPEDLVHLRALITELSLLSGGEYELHFLIHVRDNDLPIWADDEIYRKVLESSLPLEFRGMGTLWSERQMSLVYGGLAESYYQDLAVHGVYRSTFMPVQHFAHERPEFDFIWNWEMDIRYTGHYLDFVSRINEWTTAQPRKGLWQRNERFYVPAEHGTWEDFKQEIRVDSERHDQNDKPWQKDSPYAKASEGPAYDSTSSNPVWGPITPPNDDLASPDDLVEPPITYSTDKYEWGVGEQADLITLNPLFDPSGTDWLLASDVTGYNTTRPDYADILASLPPNSPIPPPRPLYPPRRAAIITTSRLSRRLLNLMHLETTRQRHAMFSEMYPASIALHYGLKAVYAPHPMYIDRRWPTSYLQAVFNAGVTSPRSSIFGEAHRHNLRGTTFYYDAGFAPNLYRRWLGYKVDNDGGEVEELAGEGRMCLPPMLLHPVKNVAVITDDAERDMKHQGEDFEEKDREAVEWSSEGIPADDEEGFDLDGEGLVRLKGD